MFDVWLRPMFTGEDDDEDEDREVRIRHYALNGFFNGIASGRSRAALCVDHDTSFELCSTDDGTLKLWRTDDALMFNVSASRGKGRNAIMLARSLPNHCEVSVGGNFRKEVGMDRPGVPVTVMDFDLLEISLVRSGACAGVWAKIL